MEFHLKIGLVCVSTLFCFQCISSEEPLDGSGALKWTCLCATGTLGALDHSPVSNCSTSCDCIPDGETGAAGRGWNCSCGSGGQLIYMFKLQANGETGAAGRGWNCSCGSGATPQDTVNINDTSCFTACNCSSGTLGTSTAPKNNISKRSVIVMVLSVVLTAIMVSLTSIACYFYHRDRISWKPPIFSSDKDTSWNSAANLISHQSGSFPGYQVKNDSSFNPITGFIQRLSIIFRNERRTLPGAIIQFSYSELEQATNKFSDANLIGRGGSSNVYHGQFKDGRVVAIKKLKALGGSEAESSFLTEIELISRLNHCHVVPLLGYCSESQGKQAERLLVFEYMSNGNLRDCLDATQGKEPMDWGTRVGIALGAAKGLEYLHEAAAPRILHRDIKSSNILLDDSYRAKITDLGMAKCLSTDDPTSSSSSPARMLGTFGYFAPEYAIVGKASLKSDVFSFGVVILELITGRLPIQKSTGKGDESLVIWATARLCDSRSVISELPDPLLKGNFPEEEMQIMAHLARECLQWDPDSRPTMSEVVQILSTITPDKSKRRNYTASFLKSSSLSIKNTNEEKLDSTRAASERFHARCSLPLAIDRNLCENNQEYAETVLSSEKLQRLILTASNCQSLRSSDDDTVDLTEPRFESFMLGSKRYYE